MAGDAGSITRVAGIEVGHFTETRRPTGCTVIITREGAVAGVDVRGAAPVSYTHLDVYKRQSLK